MLSPLARSRDARLCGFPPSPEIENADLTGLALDLVRWGAKTPVDLSWLNPPCETPWRLARDRLVSSNALRLDGEITALGKRLSDFPLPPRLALMVLRGAEIGQAQLAADIAALLSERDLGGRSTDLDQRLSRFRVDSGQRGRAMRDLAIRWAKLAGGKPAAPISAAAVLALGFPERIGRLRGSVPGRFILADGRGAVLDETDPMTSQQWIVIADMTGAGPDLRITLAGRYTEGEALSSDAIETREEARYDHDARRVCARRAKMLGAIGLEDGPLPAPSGDLVRHALLDAIREQGLGLLRHGDGAQTIIGRIELLSRAIGDPWPAAFGQRAMSRLEEWLGPQLGSPGALNSLSSGQIADALRSFELSKFPCRDSCRADCASAAFAVSFKSNFSKSLRDRRDLC
ncbi:MAG: hypothetical protein IPO30_14960 [Hyphomonadaceae bacterium]|nr:hypothetical protein [Hyphomonadaceae bacterium]